MVDSDLRVVHPCVDSDGKHLGYSIFCPACRHGHLLDSKWSFNGDFIKPTFHPSLLQMGNPEERKRTKDRYGHRCHSFIRDGKIQFLGDCTHSLKNQTVDLKPF